MGIHPVHKQLLQTFRDVSGEIHDILHRKVVESDNDEWEEEGEESKKVSNLSPVVSKTSTLCKLDTPLHMY